MFNKSWKNKLIAFCTAVTMVVTVLQTPISVYAEEEIPVDTEIVEDLEENEVNEVNEIINEPSDNSENSENIIESYEFPDETSTVYTVEPEIVEPVNEECVHDFVYQTCYNGMHKQVCLLCGKENEATECIYTYEAKNETKHIAKCSECSFTLEENHEFETVITELNECKNVCKHCGYEISYETTVLEKTVGDYVITAEGAMPAGITLSVRKIGVSEKINSIVGSLVDSSAGADFETVQEIVTESEAKQEEIINEEIAVLDEVEDAAEIETLEEELINISLENDEEVVIESPETTPVVCSFDITLLDENGNEWQPVEHGTTVNINISLLGGSLPEEVGIVRIEDIYNEEYTELEVNEKDDTSVSFDTDHFTLYTIYNTKYSTTIAYSGTVSTDGSGSISYTLYSNGILHLTGKVGSYGSSNDSSSKNFQMTVCRINKWNFPTFHSSSRYDVGDNVYYDGTYYTCVTAGSGSIDNFEEITDEETLAFTQVKKIIIDLDEGCYTKGLFCGMHNLEVAIFADGMSGQIIDGEALFNYDENLKYIIFNGVKFSNLKGTFTGCQNLLSVKGLCGESVSSLGKAFIGANSLTTLDLSGITLADDGDCGNMLYNNPNLKYIDLSTISTTSTNTIYYSDYFSPTFAPSLTTFKTPCVGSAITLPYEMYLEGTGDAYTEIAANTPSMTLYKNSTGTATNGEYTIVDGKTYVYSDAVYTWDVSDAEDGSVMAYIWADGLMLLEGDGDFLNSKDSGSYWGVPVIGSFYSIRASIKDDEFTKQYNTNSWAKYTSDWRKAGVYPWAFLEPSELVKKIIVNGNVKMTGKYFALFSFPNLVSADLKNIDASELHIVPGMFYEDKLLKTVEMPVMPSVEDISDMFLFCKSLEQIDLSSLAGAPINKADSLFYYCEQLTSCDLSSLNFSNVSDISGIFYYCKKLDSLQLPTNFVNNNTTDFGSTFYECRSLQTLDTTGWTTDSNKTLNMHSTFKYCTSLGGTLDLSFITSDVYLENTFEYMSVVEIIDVSNVKSVIPLKTDNGGNYTYYYYYDVSDPNNIKPIDGKENYKKVKYNHCFSYCKLLKEIKTGDGFRLSGNLVCCFSDCSSLESIDAQKIFTGKITNAYGLFSSCTSLIDVKNLDQIDFSECECGFRMFYNCKNLETIDFGNNAFENCSDFSEMFYYCQKLTEIDLSKFEIQDYSNMMKMFSWSAADVTWNENQIIKPVSIRELAYKSTNSKVDLSQFDLSGLYPGDNHLHVTSSTYYVISNPHMLVTPYVWGSENRFQLTSNYEYRVLSNDKLSIGDEVYTNGNMTTAPTNTVLVDNNHVDEDGNHECDVCGYQWEVFEVDGKEYKSYEAVYTWDISENEDRSVMAYVWDDGLMLWNGDGNLVSSNNNSSTAWGRALSKSAYYSIDLSYLASINDTAAKHQSIGTTGSAYEKYTYANWRTGHCYPWLYREPNELIKKVVIRGNINILGSEESSYLVYPTYMFSLLNLESIDLGSLSGLKSMYGMFNNCHNLTSVDFTTVDLSGVTTISNAFSYCENLVNVKFAETGKVSSISNAFEECSSLTSLDLSPIDFDLSSIDSAFKYCRNLAEIKGTLKGNCKYASSAFKDCKLLESLDLSNLDFSEVSDVDLIFNNCQNLSNLQLPKNFINVNTTSAWSAFGSCKKLKSVDMSDWEVNPDKTVNMISLFSNTGLEGKLDLSWINCTVKANEMFMNSPYITEIDLSNVKGVDQSGFGMDFTYSYGKFDDNPAVFYGCTALTKINTGENFRIKGKLSGLFSGCENLESIDILNFVDASEPVSGTICTFYNCKNLTEIKNFDKLDFSQCVATDAMFQNCSSLGDIDLSKADLSSVVSFSTMFYNYKNKVLWNPDVTLVPKDITNMFFNVPRQEVDLSVFDLSNLDGSTGDLFTKTHVFKTPKTWGSQNVSISVNNPNLYVLSDDKRLMGKVPYNKENIKEAPVSSVLVTNDHEDVDSDGVCDICGYIFPIDMTVAVTDGTAMYTGSPIVCNAQIDVTDPAEGYAIEYITTQPVSDPANITVKTDGTYKFEQDADTWTSNNKGVKSSEAVTEWEITTDKNVTLPISYTVSSEKNYDKFNLYVDDVNVVTDVSGYSPAVQGTYQAELSAGTHTIKAKYSKDSSMDSGNDCVAIKFENLTEQIVSDTMPSFTEIGSYQIRFRVTGVVGYNDYEGTVNFSITRPFGPWIIDEKTYTVEDAIYAWDISKLEDGSVKAFVFDDGLMIWDGEGSIVGEGFDRPYASSSSESPNLSEISSAATFNPSYNSSGGYFVDGSIIYTGTTWREKHIWPWTCADTMRTVTKLRVFGDIKTDTEARSMFFLPFCETMDLTGLDTTACTNMSSMFRNAENYNTEGCALKSITFGPNFNTSNVINMSNMFNFCRNLESLDLSYFDTSKVKYMNNMFYDCGSEDPNFTFTIPDGFVTSNCETLHCFMWNFGKSTTNFNFDFIKTWNTSNVIAMSNCFLYCGESASVSEIDCTGFDFGKVKYAYNMFSGSSAENILFDLSNTDFAKCINASLMFESCKNLKELNLTGINTANITNMQCMFRNCTNLEHLDIGSFDMRKVTNCGEMLYGCRNLISFVSPLYYPSTVSSDTDIVLPCKMEGYIQYSGLLKAVETLNKDVSYSTNVEFTKLSTYKVVVPAKLELQEEGNFDIKIIDCYIYSPKISVYATGSNYSKSFSKMFYTSEKDAVSCAFTRMVDSSEITVDDETIGTKIEYTVPYSYKMESFAYAGDYEGTFTVYFGKEYDSGK